MTMTHDRKRLLILSSIVALGPLAIDMYLPSLPALQSHFHSTPAAAQLTLSFYFLGLAVGQMFYGPISDRIGRLRPLRFGLALFVLASLGCVLAPGIGALAALRLLQALGGCAGMVIVRAIVRDLYPPQDMARVLSLMLLIMGVAPVLAPLVGGWIFTAFGWQAIFVLLMLYGAACLTLVSRALPETAPPSTARLHPAHVLGAYLRMLRHRKFMGYALAGGIAQAGMFAYISASSFVFMGVYGASANVYGVIFGVNACGLIAGSQLNARLTRTHRSERILVRALTGYAAAGLVLLASACFARGGILSIAVPLFCCIACLGFTFPNSTAAAMAPWGDRAGTASALLGSLQFALASGSSALVGRLHDDTARPMAAVISLCGLVALLMLRTLARPHESAEAIA